MKIVIVCHSGIGNLIHTTPCAKALREMGHEVVICAWPRSVRILEGWDKARVVIDHPVTHAMHADHVIVSGCGAVWQDEWTKGQVWHAKPEKNPWTQHEVDYYMDVARKLGYEGKTPDPEVAFFRGERENILKQVERSVSLEIGNYVCVNAAYLKNDHWPLKHAGNDLYVELITKLMLSGENVVLVGSSDDKDTASVICQKASAAYMIEKNLEPEVELISLCGFSDYIMDTAAVLSEAKLVVGNDGGLMHVAAAVGTKTVTIFTFTNPVKNRPYCNGEVVMVDCKDRLTCQHGNWSRCGERGCLNVDFKKVWEKTRVNLHS